MRRRLFGRSAGGLILAATGSRLVHAEETGGHRMVLHVGSADPMMMNVALHNIINAAAHYQDRKEAVAIELVANGPGYTMLRADRSPVRELIAEVHGRYPFVVFSACQNSRKAIAAAEGKSPQEIPEVPEARDVPAGIVRLSELQEQGWSYIRV